MPSPQLATMRWVPLPVCHSPHVPPKSVTKTSSVLDGSSSGPHPPAHSHRQNPISVEVGEGLYGMDIQNPHFAVLNALCYQNVVRGKRKLIRAMQAPIAQPHVHECVGGARSAAFDWNGPSPVSLTAAPSHPGHAVRDPGAPLVSSQWLTSPDASGAGPTHLRFAALPLRSVRLQPRTVRATARPR